LAPQTEFAKITTGQRVSTSILQSDGFGNKDVATITNAWNPDQAGASNSPTAWTMRWTRTPTDASAFGAKIGGTVYAGIWYNKGADINNLWKIQAPF
jgi:hypothetical protein